MKKLFSNAIGLAALAIAAAANATSIPVKIPAAYVRVALDHGVPPVVLFTVMMQESTKKVSYVKDGKKKDLYLPWPWTLNVELKSYYYATEHEAKAALRQFLATDNKRIAVGLGQIYLPSHGHLFDDKTQLLEPEINLPYAAKLLAENFQWTLEQGKPSWWIAVGRYHTPSRLDLAIPYREAAFKRCQRLFGDCSKYGALNG
jgi:hypothetical protein